jgi:phosphoglycolate phosphatase-like HAD superfamily hydrolase
MIKLVAFDWNGTLLSDTNLVVRSETILMKHFGMPAHSLKRAQEHFQIPIRNYWVSLGSTTEDFDKNEKEIGKIFYENYQKGENACRTRAGAKTILKWLDEHKFRRIIFSNHTIPSIERQLSRLGIQKYIDAILARPEGDMSHMRKRSKDIKLAKYVKNLKLKPKEVIVTGDTTEEIEIGKKLGYHTVALTGGNQSTKRLINAKPDYLINNLIELKDIIAKI